MVIDTDAKQLFAWYNYRKGYEEWFVIDYAGHEEVSLLDLMRAMGTKMANRYYSNYSEFEITDIVPTEDTYLFPLEGSYYASDSFSLAADSFSDLEYRETE